MAGERVPILDERARRHAAGVPLAVPTTFTDSAEGPRARWSRIHSCVRNGPELSANTL